MFFQCLWKVYYSTHLSPSDNQGSDKAAAELKPWLSLFRKKREKKTINKSKSSNEIQRRLLLLCFSCFFPNFFCSSICCQFNIFILSIIQLSPLLKRQLITKLGLYDKHAKLNFYQFSFS